MRLPMRWESASPGWRLTGMARRATIDRRAPDAVVLRDMRGHRVFAAFHHEVSRVVGLVGAERDRPGAIGAPSVPAVVEAVPATEPVPVSGPLQAAETAPAQGEGKKGVATYYARRFNGRLTTSGVPYDPNKLTAAHQSLPFGTQVKVVNLANGREVTVTVNDRCRKRSFPFIDLSRAAAERLGFFGKGTAKVKIIPMSSGGP
jgi:rare lipoprotein A